MWRITAFNILTTSRTKFLPRLPRSRRDSRDLVVILPKFRRDYRDCKDVAKIAETSPRFIFSRRDHGEIIEVTAVVISLGLQRIFLRKIFQGDCWYRRYRYRRLFPCRNYCRYVVNIRRLNANLVIYLLIVYLIKKSAAHRESTDCTQCLLRGGRAACVRSKIRFLLIILY